LRYVLKIDVDLKLSDEELEMFIETRKAIAEKLGIAIRDIVSHESKRGYHFFFHIDADSGVTEKTLNFYQFLFGDDPTRYKINRMRIEKGIPWDKANILFSKVLEKHKGRCEECKIYEVIKEWSQLEKSH